MNVTLKHSLAGNGFDFRFGQTVKCSDKTGKSLIAADFAALAVPAVKPIGEIFGETAVSKVLSEGRQRLSDARERAEPIPGLKQQREKATTAKAETATTGPEPEHCTGETKQGNPCMRAPLPGTDRCAAHPKE